MSDSDINDIAPKGGFKPPPAFIQVKYKKKKKEFFFLLII